MADKRLRPFRTYYEDNQFSGVVSFAIHFCIRGVHLVHSFHDLHDPVGSDNYEVSGTCDGTCKLSVPDDVLLLIDRFKQTGEKAKLDLNLSSAVSQPQDEQQDEQDPFGDTTTGYAKCCGESVTNKANAPCPNCGAV